MIGIVAVMCGSLCGIASSVLVFEMVDKVNERLPERQKFTRLGWYWFKQRTLKHEYKRLYPSGTLRQKVRALNALFFVCLLVAALALFGL